MPSYKVCNLGKDRLDNSAHILVSTASQILNMVSGRSNNLDLSELKVLVIDEADCFFLEHNRRYEIFRF